MEKQVEIPFQLQHIIDQMLNKSDNYHIRGNFRIRLSQIRDVIDATMWQYDDEAKVVPFKKRKKK